MLFSDWLESDRVAEKLLQKRMPVLPFSKSLTFAVARATLMCGKLKLGTVSRKEYTLHSTLPFFASLNVVCIIEEWERSLFTTVYHHCFLLKKQKAGSSIKS